MVEGDGSPGWVVITRLGARVRENRKIGEKSIKFDEKAELLDGNWWAGNGTGAIRQKDCPNG